MCPDTLPEPEHIGIWERVVNRINVKGIKEQDLRDKLGEQVIVTKRGVFPDKRARTLADLGFVETWFDKAHDNYDSIYARDLWGNRRVESWKGKDVMVWRDQTGRFTRGQVKIVSEKRPSRQVRRSRPRRGKFTDLRLSPEDKL